MSRAAADQTRGDSTPYISGPGAVGLSRNEVSALCMKASRGAGMSWGLAEEAGFAAGWLAERGHDGPAHLLAHLTAAQGRAWTDLCPTIVAGEWRAPSGGALCPIALGATLCDHTGLPEGPAAGSSIHTGPVDHPILLIPFLSVIEDDSGIAIGLHWQDMPDDMDEDHMDPMRAASALGCRHSLSLRLDIRHDTPPAAAATPVLEIGGDTIAGLNALAMRTTVPASDASRAGAGSTTNDND